MRYSVVTSAEVDNELALIYVEAADRRAVQRAADEIERLLGSSPLDRGTDYGEYHSLTVAPLRVTYAVSPADCMVTILRYTYEP
ncbi:MAG TPA: hypothetical protein VJ739_13385 [Gemmataceae bacterium]|nr:hypothetical protein [Gemmataceae bacterium]